MKLHLIKTLLGLFLLVLLIANQSMAQSPVFLEPCAQGKEPDFESGPEDPTLCQRYTPNPNLPQAAMYQIGIPGRRKATEIIALLGTNQLSGNVRVVGDFKIDVDFSFVNAVCFINSDVEILVAEDRLLTLDNAKLFCCSGLWKGILLEMNGNIETKNVTEIEDALIAIEVPCLNSEVSISHTTFNRNLRGIKVGKTGLPSCGPGSNSIQFDDFLGNTFQCTSPLNSPQNGVGFCGIFVEGNVVLHIGSISTAPSYFRHMRYGIYSVKNSETTLIVNRCRFEGLLHSGIYQASGSLTTVQTNFTNCYSNGICQDFTRNLTASICNFVYNTDLVGISSDFHIGICAREFGLGAEVSITYSKFEIDHAPEDGSGVGIYLQPVANGVGTQTQISIRLNEFDIRTDRSYGIVMDGNFLNLSPGSSRIFQNKFTLFNTTSNYTVQGIFLVGDFQQFSIIDNDFYGWQSPNVNQSNNNLSIYWYGTVNSTRNIIASNIRHLPENQTTEDELYDLDLNTAIFISDQDSASICNNQFYNLEDVGIVQNLGLVSVFSNNTFGWMARGPRIEMGTIGLQEHEGNQWTFPAIELNGEFHQVDIDQGFGYHIRSIPNPANSRFFVHTPQATVLFDEQHPFHPFDVEPDLDNEFFEQTPGTPQLCNLPGFAGGVPDMDKQLADGYTAAQLSISEAELWQNQRRLYRTLQTNASYYASYRGFSAFVAQHQGGSVGKFYQIHSLLSQSAVASVTLSSEALSQQQILRDNITEIIYLDSLLQVETSPTTIVSLKAAQAVSSEAIEFAQIELDTLQAQYEAPRSSYYQQAQAINGSVSAVAIYETNEKAVNQVMLNALLNQSGNLTEQDALALKSIASQCPLTGGTAVMKARSLLEDCYEDATNDFSSGCMGELSTQYQISTRVSTSPRSESMVQTSAVVGEDIYLNVMFVEGSRYSLYDLAGRELHSGKLEVSLHVQTPSGLSNGVYVCTVTYPSGKSIAQKVVIAR